MKEALTDTLRRRLAGQRAPLPPGGDLAWQWFADLCGTRTYGMAGPNPIGFVEIEAYARLHRWPLQPRHVDLIRAMDRVWLDHARQGDKTTRPPRAASAMTAAAFDAVFA